MIDDDDDCSTCTIHCHKYINKCSVGEDQSIEGATCESIGRLALANVNPPPIPPILPTCPSFPTHPPAQHTPLQPVASTLLLLPGKIPR